MVFHSKYHAPVPEIDVLSYLFAAPEGGPDKPIFFDALDTTHYLSWNQTRSFVRRVIGALKVKGLQPGDCVFLLAPNSIYYWPMGVGVIGAGGIFSAGSTLNTPRETLNVFRAAEARYFLVHPQFVDHAGVLQDAGLVDAANIIIFDMDDLSDKDTKATTREANVPLSTLLKGESDWVRFEGDTARKTIALRGFTSGTTGPSKVPQLSHFALVSTVVATIEGQSRRKKNKGEKDIVLWFIGLSHISGWMFAFTSAVKTQTRTYIMTMNMSKLVQACKTIKPTWMTVPPNVASTLTKLLEANDDSLRSISYCTLFGMALPLVVREKFSALLAPEANVLTPYGLTETGGVFCTDEDTMHSTSNGRLYINCRAKLVDPLDPAKEITEPLSTGEICVNNPCLFTSYLGDPVATAAAFTSDGFLRTGDLGYCDENDEWHVTGRLKEHFKVAYEHVNVTELEATLAGHPRILDAAISPVAVAGEVDPLIRAFVVRQSDGGALKEEDVLQWLQGRVAKHKMITGGVVFVDEIPRNNMGKVLRWRLEQKE